MGLLESCIRSGFFEEFYTDTRVQIRFVVVKLYE